MSVEVGEKRYIEKGFVVRSRIEITRGLEIRTVRIQQQHRSSEECMRFIWGAFSVSNWGQRQAVCPALKIV